MLDYFFGDAAEQRLFDRPAVPTVDLRGVHGWVLPHQVGMPNVYDQFEADENAPDGRTFVDEELQECVEKLGRLVTEHAGSEPVVTGAEATADD